MIQYFPHFKKQNILSYLESFNPDKETWIVSDLRTKLEIQQYFLEKKGYFKETSVLRASDFWKILFKRIEPEYRIVSVDYMKVILRRFFHLKKNELGIQTDVSRMVMQSMGLFAPILFHPNGDELLMGWFGSHPEAEKRWKDRYLLTRLAIRYIQSEKIITPTLIPAYLQNYSGEIGTYWNGDLTIDLGSELSRVEADLFVRISKHQILKLISPEPIWKKDFDFLLSPYELLKSHAIQSVESKHEEKDLKNPDHGRRFFKRFSGQLAEVKACVSTVREWLDSGVEAEAIAIIAPDIENYWPILQRFLDQEGIQTQKGTSVKMSALPSVQRWMSALRIRSKNLSSADLESASTIGGVIDHIGYEKFKSLFSQIYGYEDLDRDKKMKQYFEGAGLSNENPPRDEFLFYAVAQWSAEFNQGIETIVREVLLNAKPDIELSQADWVSYIEQILSQKELIITEGNSQGVIVTALMAAHSAKTSHRLFLGNVEEHLQSKIRGGLPPQDVESIFKELGFHLDHPDQHFKEFELRWTATLKTVEDHFYVAMSDFAGQPLNPSSIWLDLSRQQGEDSDPHRGDVPGLTRWDELQILNDLELPRSPLEIKIQFSRFILSPSAFEAYLQCPFKYFASSVLRLRNLEELDLDVGPRSDGSFAHQIFHALTTVHPIDYSMRDEQIEQLLENIRHSEEIDFADERLWSIQKRKYKKLAYNFLQFEQQWRQEFPLTKTVLSEASFGKIVEIDGHPVEFVGRVDRIDSDQNGNFLIIDYKRSPSGLSNQGSWLGKRSIQMLFYLWAFDQKFFPELDGEVRGALFYIFKDFLRSKGLLREGYEKLQPKPKGGPSSALVSEDQYRKLMNEFKELLVSSVGMIKAGKFPASPHDIKGNCEKCDFQGLCRAPHLDQ